MKLGELIARAKLKPNLTKGQLLEIEIAVQRDESSYETVDASYEPNNDTLYIIAE